MKNGLRVLALMMAVALPGFLLAACDTGDDCDAAGTSTVTVAAAAHLSAGKSGGKAGKSKPKKVKVHGSDDCEDDD